MICGEVIYGKFVNWGLVEIENPWQASQAFLLLPNVTAGQSLPCSCRERTCNAATFLICLPSLRAYWGSFDNLDDLHLPRSTHNRLSSPAQDCSAESRSCDRTHRRTCHGHSHREDSPMRSLQAWLSSLQLNYAHGWPPKLSLLSCHCLWWLLETHGHPSLSRCHRESRRFSHPVLQAEGQIFLQLIAPLLPFQIRS